MAYGLVDHNTMANIANAIRSKTGSNAIYYPRDMARAIEQIETGGDAGLDVPVMFSIAKYMLPNYSYQGAVNLSASVAFEVKSQMPVDATVIDYNAQWHLGGSNNNLKFYMRTGEYNTQNYQWNSDKYNNGEFPYDLVDVVKTGTIYGLCAAGNVNKVSVLCMDHMFEFASNITKPFCGEYTTSMKNAYGYCSQLTEAACGPYVEDMSAAYHHCAMLPSAVVGPNVTNMQQAYMYCDYVEGDVEIDKAYLLKESFYGCNRLANIFIGSTRIENDYNHLYNAFSRSGFNSIRRNIVLANIESFNNFMAFGYQNNIYAVGCKLPDEDEYLEPVSVNVANKSYDVVRCRYNTSTNVYVYCME